MNHKFYYLGILFLIMFVSDCFAQDTIFMRNDQRIPCNIVEVTSTEVKYKKWELSDGPLYIENKSLVSRIKYKNGFTDVFQEVKAMPVQPAKKAEDDYVQDRKNTKAGNDEYIQNRQRDKLTMIGGNHYIYGDQRLNEAGMQRMLLSLNDPKITREVKTAKVDKGLKYIGFAAIPLFFVGVFALTQIDQGPTYSNGYTYTHNNEFVAPALICFAGAAVTFSASIYFGIDRKARNARAVHLYQQKYEGR
jgi:hypothetical protein